jgi:hypothetical protein
MTYLLLSLVFALAAPLVLLAVEMALPYPHLVEELAKAGLVVMILLGEIEINSAAKSKQKSQYKTITGWHWVLAAGVIFTFSETVLYLVNFFQLGSIANLLPRLVLTGGLHTATMIIMYLLAKKNYWLGGLGFIAAVGLHYWFNLAVST